MKIPCEVVKDLLPLYVDGVCSEKSKQLVEQHLAECEECRIELNLMKTELPKPTREQNLEEAQILKKASKNWKKNMAESLFIGAIIMLGLIVFLVIIFIFVGFKVVQV